MRNFDKKSFAKVMTALITPFKLKDNRHEVDYVSLERLVANQLQAGVEGFVVNGTTAESPTLTDQEVKEIFSFIKKRVPAPFPLILGTGSNSTEVSIEKTAAAAKLGADAALVVVPYYNKPTQEGLFFHFTAIAEKSELPVILYNVPTRTITSLEAETIQRLSQHPKIIGIKEASGNIQFAEQLRKACGQDFLLLSGDDGSYVDFMKSGGDGVISVASHIIPKPMLEKNTKDYKKLIDLLFIEPNPAPVKMALYKMGIVSTPQCRLPLIEMSHINSEKLIGEMKNVGIIK